jgi:hypothetical protein
VHWKREKCLRPILDSQIARRVCYESYLLGDIMKTVVALLGILVSLSSFGQGPWLRNQCDVSQNPNLVCISKGYSPTICAELPDRCAAGQAQCLNKGYSPSSCATARGQQGYGYCEVSENPYFLCLEKGYSPMSCKGLRDGCAAGQAACLDKGYSPSSCASSSGGAGQRSPGYCDSSENAYFVCLNKGYSPTSCAGLTDGCASGQALCLEKGYSPSSCVSGKGRPGYNYCDSSENPYVSCLNKGYSPTSCAGLTDGCAAGQALCLEKGYSPTSCLGK